jgi:hypothetical protein
VIANASAALPLALPRSSRITLFDREPVAGLSGLAGLTAPTSAEVAVVVDAVVIGAKSDGKTQFITHAIRTLDAHAPAGLSSEERLLNEKMLGLVLNAKRPLPEANPDQKVRHYVFRVKAENLLAGLLPMGQLALLVRARRLGWWLALALAQAAVIALGLRVLRGAFDAATLVGGAVAAAASLWWAVHIARRSFARGQDAEIVFWDVAGEDVYSDRGAGAYHQFLAALVAARRERAEAGGPAHALAPILICNPLAVGRLAGDSPYSRLRMIMPSFAALGGPRPEVLVVVNRWDLARVVCGDGEGAADDHLAILPIARDAPLTVASAGTSTGALDPLPVLKREVVLRHCLDGEPVEVGATRFRTIHYDAGLETEVKEIAWAGWDALPEDARARWRAPGGDVEVKGLIEYRYAEGPGALGGEAASSFYHWLAAAMWRPRGKGAIPPDVAAAATPAATAPATVVRSEDEALEPALDDPGRTVKMFGPLVPAAERGARGGGDEPPAGPAAGGENRGGFRSGT